MRLRTRHRNMITRALGQALSVVNMVKIVHRIWDSYNIHARTGIPESMTIGTADAARQIVTDLQDAGLILLFIEYLVRIERDGMAGRPVRIPQLEQIIVEFREHGYVFDWTDGTFYEDETTRKSANWGVLIEGFPYRLGFLAIDIKGNSELVRRHGREVMDEVYGSLRRIILRVIDKRSGRLWLWEGDGGLIAFRGSEMVPATAHSGMEILHELILYNAARNPIGEPIQCRLAATSGEIVYTDSIADMQSSPAVKAATEMESHHTAPNMFTIGSSDFAFLETPLQQCFQVGGASGDTSIRSYAPSFRSAGASS